MPFQSGLYATLTGSSLNYCKLGKTPLKHRDVQPLIYSIFYFFIQHIHKYTNKTSNITNKENKQDIDTYRIFKKKNTIYKNIIKQNCVCIISQGYLRRGNIKH